MHVISAIIRLVVAFLIAVWAAGCSDFSTPAELDHAQIIAVRAEPPAVMPGERARLEVLVAGPDGPLSQPPASWSVAGGGAVAVDDSGVAVVVDGDVGSDVVWVDVEVDIGGEILRARKALVIGAGPATNPEVRALWVGDLDAGDEPVVVGAGSTVPLAVDMDPEPGEGALVSWYSTVGDIDRYRLADSELVAPPAADSGWLMVVVRDGRGGVGWRIARLRVE